MFLKKCAVAVALAFLVAAACARSTASPEVAIVHEEEESARAQDSAGNYYFGGIKFAYKIYKDCAAGDLSTCLKLKLLAAMDRAERSYSEMNIVDGVSLVRQKGIASELPPKSESEIETALPRSLDQKNAVLNSLIMDRIANFFTTHTLQVRLPRALGLEGDSEVEEGRKKKNKGSGIKGDSHVIIPMVLGGTLIPLSVIALALFAGKAFVISKLALVIASIIGLRRIITGGNGAGVGEQQKVVVTDTHGDYNYARALEEEEAQNRAFKAYAHKRR